MSETDLQREMAAGIVHYEDSSIPLRIKEYTITAPSIGRNIPHWHEDFEIVQVLDGLCLYKINDDRILLQKGDLLFINSRVMHVNTRGDSEQMRARCLLFQPSILSANRMVQEKYIETIYRTAPFDYILFPRNTGKTRECIRWMDMVYSAKQSGLPAYELDVLAALHGLMACVYRHTAGIVPAVYQRTYTAQQERIMLAYIYRNYSEKVTLKDIAASAGISTHRCCEIFREKIGFSPVEYLNYYRLHAASGLLAASEERTVQQIASACGFDSSAYFTSQFKKQFGLTPKEYRRRLREEKSAAV